MIIAKYYLSALVFVALAFGFVTSMTTAQPDPPELDTAPVSGPGPAMWSRLPPPPMPKA